MKSVQNKQSSLLNFDISDMTCIPRFSISVLIYSNIALIFRKHLLNESVIMQLSLIKALRSCIEFRLPPAIKRTPLFSNYNYCRSLSRPYSVHKQELVNKMATEKTLPQIFKYVDQNVESYKSLLKEAVAIPSVSSDVKYRDDCVRMVHWMQDKLKEVGATTELRDVGFQTIDGKEVKLPPVLVGVLGNVSIQYLFLLN